MRFTFGKVYENRFGNKEILVNHPDFRGQAIEFTAMFDEDIDAPYLFEVSELGLGDINAHLETLNTSLKNDYRLHQKKKTKRVWKRNESKVVNHWWNALDLGEKERLCQSVTAHIIDIVDKVRRPNDIKSRHYDSLIKRSQLGTLQLTHKIDDRKLMRLPKYDSQTKKLYGSPRSFIALAECIYPSLHDIKTKELMQFG